MQSWRLEATGRILRLIVVNRLNRILFTEGKIFSIQPIHNLQNKHKLLTKVIIRLKQPNSSLVVIFRRRWWYGPGSVSQESHRWYSSVQTLRSMLSTTNNKFIVAFCILGRRSILAEEDLSFSRIRRQRIRPDRPLPSVKRGFRDFGRRKLASKLTRPQS